MMELLGIFVFALTVFITAVFHISVREKRDGILYVVIVLVVLWTLTATFGRWFA